MADGSVGKSLRYGDIDPWRLKNKITFGHYDTQQQDISNQCNTSTS